MVVVEVFPGKEKQLNKELWWLRGRESDVKNYSHREFNY